MDYETLYVLYQSRKTLLKILAGRGYNTTPYEKFGPLEISAMAAANAPEVFRMDLEKTSSSEDASAIATATDSSPITKCRVVYAINSIKNKIATFINDLVKEDDEDAVDPATTEVIVILVRDAMAEAFHTAALSSFANRSLRLRISFFRAHQLVNNPLDHVLVPKHERLPPSTHDTLLSSYKIKSKAQLPRIKFHEDMIGRILGLIPGDIVKISSYSPSAGEYLKFRVCVP